MLVISEPRLGSPKRRMSRASARCQAGRVNPAARSSSTAATTTPTSGPRISDSEPTPAAAIATLAAAVTIIRVA